MRAVTKRSVDTMTSSMMRDCAAPWGGCREDAGDMRLCRRSWMLWTCTGLATREGLASDQCGAAQSAGRPGDVRVSPTLQV